MRVLILHNHYQRSGGEDAVVAQEAALLSSAAHEVQVETVSNDAIGSTGDRLRTFLRTPYDPARKGWVAALIKRHRPDVVHIHNFFPLLTPAVHEAASDMGAAVVQTLHNYRTICASALLMRKETVCEKCLTAGRHWALIHRCYRNSYAGSLATVRMQAQAVRRGSWTAHVHRFIALTEFSRLKFIAGGLPAERIAVKPNFVTDHSMGTGRARRGALFVGRLSAEKGVHTLVEAWRRLPDVPLTIVGDGPERARLEASSPNHVRLLGWRQPDEVRALMAGAQALVMPSVWYEAFPMTIAESFASGLPVLASRLGAMAELIEDGGPGMHFEPGDVESLAGTARRAFDDPARLLAMGRAARAAYERLYTPEKNLARLEEIYGETIAEARQWPSRHR